MTLPADFAEGLLRSMLSIPSVSGQEARIAAYLADQMAALGLEVSTDAAGNVHGVIGPAGAPTVMLLGHIDTVPGQVPVCRVGDYLYGRGAVDAKGPMAAMVCAAASQPPGMRVHVVGAVGEETAGSQAIRHLMAKVPPPDAVVIGEPSGWDGVCLGYKGRVGVVYETRRTVLHTSSPEETAAEAAVEFADGVQAYLQGLATDADPLSFAAATGTLVQLSGDLGTADALIDCRVPPGFDFDAFEAHVRAIACGEVRFDERVPAVHRRRSDVVASVLRGAIKAHGGEPVLKLKSGTSFMNDVDTWGVPMAAYGPGDAHLDHTSDEHIPLADLARSITVLTTALGRLATKLRRPAARAVGAPGAASATRVALAARSTGVA